jgi:DNA-binding transcriptional MerR regulator
MQFVPKKLYYKIKEVCEIVGVEAHVLRFWETEFPSLAPPKSKSGQRTYRPRDIELLLRIRKLLYVDGFTIAGARKQLSMRKAPDSTVGESTFDSPEWQDDDRKGATQVPEVALPRMVTGTLPGMSLNPSPASTGKLEKVSSSRSQTADNVSEDKDLEKEGLPQSANKARQPSKPSSEHLKRVQSELENILTLLDRE